jgi:hypothetical protein
MLIHTFKRLLYVTLVVVGVSIICFLLVHGSAAWCPNAVFANKSFEVIHFQPSRFGIIPNPHSISVAAPHRPRDGLKPELNRRAKTRISFVLMSVDTEPAREVLSGDPLRFQDMLEYRNQRVAPGRRRFVFLLENLAHVIPS